MKQTMRSDWMKRAHRTGWISLVILLSLGFTTPLLAGKPGENVEVRYGFLNRVTEDSASTEEIWIQPPEAGRTYQIKVRFFKAETAAKQIDDYFDNLPKTEDHRLRAAGWNAIRGGLKSIKSEAEYEVFDAAGRSIGSARDLGLTAFFRTVKFTAESSQYRIVIRCTKGAGAFRMTFEYQ